MNRGVVFAFVFGLGMSVAYAAAPTKNSEDEHPVDRVVAVIDDDIITERELLAEAQPHLEPIAQMPVGKERTAARRRALRHALDKEIDERLMVREIEKSRDKLGVSERDIDHAQGEVMRMNHLTEPQLVAALMGQGLTMASYRVKLREQLERTRLIQFRVQGKVQIKDADVQRRCEQQTKLGSTHVQVCARHILLKVSGEAKASEIKAIDNQAHDLVKKLKSGADFVQLARRYNEDTAAQDGQLGCFSQGEMVEAFEEAAFALPVGGISEVVITPFGRHIMQITDRKATSQSSCDEPETREMYRNELAQEEMTRHMASYLSELRARAFVEVRL